MHRRCQSGAPARRVKTEKKVWKRREGQDSEGLKLVESVRRGETRVEVDVALTEMVAKE